MNSEQDRLSHFMRGLTAAQLLQRAGENGSFVEYICLATAVIDASLRIGLILQHQIKTRTDEILDSLLYQKDEDRIVSERQIYRKALQEDILSKDLFDKLESLYEKRNRVVHRYIISDITTEQVLDIGIQYEKINPLISEAVGKLEQRQIETRVGMTVVTDGASKAEMETLFNKMSAEKHGNPTLAHSLRGKRSI
jgi:uncharacterized protein YutE (UPF0331/DUF86 family)